jgi:hypothetical protein
VPWERQRYDWLPRFPDGCEVSFGHDGMIVVDHRGQDVTEWALRPPFYPVTECPYCDRVALHFMFEPSFEGDPPDSGRPVITRECSCGRQWLERMI